MGYEVASACQGRGMELAEVALSGPDFDGTTVEVGPTTVKLVGPDGADEAAQALVKQCQADGKILVAIDYTVPAACVPNAELYARNGISFVLGTTGGDVEKMTKAVLASKETFAVIAPNMAKQIVALQAAIEIAAKEFPGAFKGYELHVIESHQTTKKDTSGTAKAIVSSLVDLVDETEDTATAIQKIERVRDEPTQLDGAGTRLQKVPEENLKGHAYHTYSLTSPAGDVRFELRHNVNGRRVYADGTADAVIFLANQIKSGSADNKRIYNMIDVLKSGALS